MCRVLGVSRTGFHNWERRAPSDRALQDAWLTEKIKRIHEASRGVYGVPQDPRRAADRARHPGRAQAGRAVDESRRYRGRQAEKAVEDDDPDPGDHPGDRPRRARLQPRPGRTCCGSLTSPTCAPGRAGCTSPRSRTPTPAGSSAGRWPTTCARARRRRAEDGARAPAPRARADPPLRPGRPIRVARVRPRRATRPGSRSRWAPAATPTTTPSPRRSSRPSRRNSSTAAAGPTRLELQSAVFEYIEAFYNRQRRHSTLGMLSPVAYEQLRLSPLGG